MSDMTRAYDLAAVAVRRRLAEQHPEQLAALNQLRQSDVAVFRGSYDRMQEVLRRLRVPFTLDPKRLTARVIFANCSAGNPPSTVKRIAGRVADGAYLVATDHALQHVVQAGFPGTIRWDGKQGTGTCVIGVEANLGSTWATMVVPGADPQWCLDGGSYPITIEDEAKVTVEAASHELLISHGKPAVAVRFHWGAGQVYHVISHVWLKTTRAPGARHQGPGVDFLRVGMKLSEAGIAAVLAEAKLKPDALNFATVQSAVTATELAARLCIDACRPAVNNASKSQ